VPVIAVGQDAFPAFWSRDSGLKAPLRLDTAEEIAAAHRMRAASACPAGNWWPTRSRRRPRSPPRPRAADRGGQAEAGREGRNGKAVTPFLLQWLFERTEGRTLRPISPL
jgi:pseudouridine-5'-phosphate glycosidase